MQAKEIGPEKKGDFSGDDRCKQKYTGGKVPRVYKLQRQCIKAGQEHDVNHVQAFLDT